MAGFFQFGFDRNLLADDVILGVQISENLVDWTSADGIAVLTGTEDLGGGIRGETWQLPIGSEPRQFVRLAVSLR